jgi:hypothetical protein
MVYINILLVFSFLFFLIRYVVILGRVFPVDKRVVVFGRAYNNVDEIRLDYGFMKDLIFRDFESCSENKDMQDGLKSARRSLVLGVIFGALLWFFLVFNQFF